MTHDVFFTDEMLEDAVNPGWFAEYARRKLATIHVTFTSDEQAFKYVNGVSVPVSPYRGYTPDAFVVLKDVDVQASD